MKPVEFVYWLQGYFELSEDKTLTEKQVTTIKNHLALVFEHAIDPSYTSHLSPEDAKKVQENLQTVHDGGPFPGVKPPYSKPGPSPVHDPNTVYRC